MGYHFIYSKIIKVEKEIEKKKWNFYYFTVNEMESHWVHTLLNVLYVLYWPDDGPLWPKHVA